MRGEEVREDKSVREGVRENEKMGGSNEEENKKEQRKIGGIKKDKVR